MKTSFNRGGRGEETEVESCFQVSPGGNYFQLLTINKLIFKYFAI